MAAQRELELPDAGPAAYLIDLYYRVGSGRQSGMGLNPFAWADLRDFCGLYGLRLRAWELDALREIDATVLDEHRQHQQQQAERRKAHPSGSARR